MKIKEVDILIIGAGPVGLLCAYLAHLSGLSFLVIDKSEGPLQVGRADALNARTLQLLHVAGLFKEIYPLGKPCNTSSVWKGGKFISRESSWWEALEGCQHKHFLMLGQSHLEKILDEKLKGLEKPVKRKTSALDIQVTHDSCVTFLSSGETIRSKYLIGSDGSRSFVRNHFEIKFEITRPELIWAVVDGIIETDFPKVPEIINFQTETSDVAWIPREGEIDRFYIRMDKKDYTQEEVLKKINRAMAPHTLSFREIIWSSQFSVKESVAESYSVKERVFLAGDACHIHSVNGGQGLNTGIGDAFNLIWKMKMIIKHQHSKKLLQSYENERKAVAREVIATSGELVRSTKYSASGTHAEDYVKIVQRRASFITGMGIRYGERGEKGNRLYDLKLSEGARLYDHLDYRKHTLLCFSELAPDISLPEYIKLVHIRPKNVLEIRYDEKYLLVSPDSYIVGLWEVATGLDS
jgi:2-polyprenyl-6-methoxyphenol hydroxylase-like FAD-dependent oxidoreductase